jgi:hypothetical protein
MNERIKELWSQAEEEIKAEYEDESRRNRRLYNEIFLPKFAELIVQECIDIIAPYSVRMIKPGEEYLHPIQEIKNHFGVEL